MAGKVITPRQLAQQWLRLPNKFEVNVFNFETLVGNAAKKIFRDSFYLRRFNSALRIVRRGWMNSFLK